MNSQFHEDYLKPFNPKKPIEFVRVYTESEVLRLLTSVVSSTWCDNGYDIGKVQQNYNHWLSKNGFKHFL